MKEMKEKIVEGCKNCNCNCHHYHHKHSGGCGVYGLGFIGAAIYFMSPVTTFGAGVLGFLKALVWPAYLVFNALKFLIR